MDAIYYVVDIDIKWRTLPMDFPPWSTVYNYFAAWEAARVTQDGLDGLRDRVVTALQTHHSSHSVRLLLGYALHKENPQRPGGVPRRRQD